MLRLKSTSLLMLIMAGCADTVAPAGEEPPSWPCHIGVWLCAENVQHLTIPFCRPCEGPNSTSNGSCPRYGCSFRCTDVQARDCTSAIYFAILPTGRVVQWVASFSPSNRLIGSTPLPGAWYWRMEGEQLVLSGLEGGRASPGCGNPSYCRRLPGREVYIPTSSCRDDSFDAIATSLTASDWDVALNSLPTAMRWGPDVTRMRVCRRADPSLAVGILRTIHAEDYNHSIIPSGPTYAY